MKKLSIIDKIIIRCVLFLIEGLGRISDVFYNFNVDKFTEDIKTLLKGDKE